MRKMTQEAIEKRAMGLYKCSSCQEWKGKESFSRNATYPKRDELDYLCTGCRKEVATDVRVLAKTKLRHSRWVKRNWDKVYAHQVVRKLIASGKLVRQPCFLCEETPTQGHHLDYSYPKKVVWLCQKHHHKITTLERELRQKIS